MTRVTLRPHIYLMGGDEKKTMHFNNETLFCWERNEDTILRKAEKVHVSHYPTNRSTKGLQMNCALFQPPT